MRFNFISEHGDGTGFAVRCLREGCDVRMYIKDPIASEVGEGIVPKVGEIDDMLEDGDKMDDVFIFDGTGHGLVAEYIKNQGFYVMGDSLIATRMERDRDYASRIMEEMRIEIPKTVKFASWDEALAFAAEADENERFVYKPSKHLSEASMSKVTYDKTDLLDLLEDNKKTSGVAEPEFILQEFIKGAEISTEGWYDGARFVDGLFNHTIERKQFLNGDIGPSGGCTGNIVWRCDGECPICKAGIRKLDPFLRKFDYLGPIDLNGIWRDGELYGLEFTPRFGYDAAPTLAYGLLDGELGRFFSDLARHQYTPDSPALRESIVAAGLRVSIPPWPTERHEAEKDVPLRGIKDEDIDDFYLYDVKQTESGRLASAGAWGILFCLVGSGVDIEKAYEKPYKLVEDFKIPDVQYRTDLVKVFEKSFEELQATL